jgi:hypothetical protein
LVSKYVCPHCGNDGSRGDLTKNVIILAFRHGAFDSTGHFEPSDGGSPEYESESIVDAATTDPDLSRNNFYCGACQKGFDRPKKVE